MLELPFIDAILAALSVQFMKKIALLLAPLLMFAACKKSDVTVQDPGIGTEIVTQAMPKGGVFENPDYGKEMWLAVGPIAGLDDYPANGVVQGHLFEDGTYSHSVQANIAIPEDGFFYEGWLVNEKTKEFVSTGQMHNNFGDVRHYLQFEEKKDLRAYAKVIITLEPDDGDPAPAKHVAEGLLKEQKR